MKMSTFTTSIQHSFESPSHSNQKNNKQIKGIQIIEEESKLTLFADDIILYRENPKDFTKNPLELINEFSKVQEYKFNIQKLVAFLYTNDELYEREIKKTTSFTTASKTISYQGIKLSKQLRDLFSKIMSLKKIKDTNKWKQIPY
uniref:Reverse transcriptase domain-containing protein n=1 Tax=Rousettus aegyptiacus TaxID=9407 RepID=A0A7J8EKM6_ROUAE|nr:hypothetical protein HJG63_012548 [Rousettus aegyptiacus]